MPVEDIPFQVIKGTNIHSSRSAKVCELIWNSAETRMKSGSGGQFLGRKYFPLGNRLKALVGNELSESTHTFAERLDIHYQCFV
jgi:hypothetical protein